MPLCQNTTDKEMGITKTVYMINKAFLNWEKRNGKYNELHKTQKERWLLNKIHTNPRSLAADTPTNKKKAGNYQKIVATKPDVGTTISSQRDAISQRDSSRAVLKTLQKAAKIKATVPEPLNNASSSSDIAVFGGLKDGFTFVDTQFLKAQRANKNVKAEIPALPKKDPVFNDTDEGKGSAAESVAARPGSARRSGNSHVLILDEKMNSSPTLRTAAMSSLINSPTSKAVKNLISTLEVARAEAAKNQNKAKPLFSSKKPKTPDEPPTNEMNQQLKGNPYSTFAQERSIRKRASIGGPRSSQSSPGGVGILSNSRNSVSSGAANTSREGILESREGEKETTSENDITGGRYSGVRNVKNFLQTPQVDGGFVPIGGGGVPPGGLLVNGLEPENTTTTSGGGPYYSSILEAKLRNIDEDWKVLDIENENQSQIRTQIRSKINSNSVNTTNYSDSAIALNLGSRTNPRSQLSLNPYSYFEKPGLRPLIGGNKVPMSTTAISLSRDSSTCYRILPQARPSSAPGNKTSGFMLGGLKPFVLDQPTTQAQHTQIIKEEQLARSIDILGARFEQRKSFLRPKYEPLVTAENMGKTLKVQGEDQILKIGEMIGEWRKKKAEKESNARIEYLREMQHTKEREEKEQNAEI